MEPQPERLLGIRLFPRAVRASSALYIGFIVALGTALHIKKLLSLGRNRGVFAYPAQVPSASNESIRSALRAAWNRPLSPVFWFMLS